MTKFVLIEVVAREMASYAPPAWCKLALYGAIYSERVRLYSARGNLRAYVPKYHLAPSEHLPALAKQHHTFESLLDDYGLSKDQIDVSQDVTVWSEQWKDEPKLLALGWFYFREPFSWDNPVISLDYFDIPSDYRELFAYDDLHPEGEPDPALYYEGSFFDLCLTIEHAESILPMCDFEKLAFGSKNDSPIRKIGRPKGSGLESADEPLVREMLAERKQNSTLNARNLAEKYVDRASGHGTRDSKIKRLERRLRDYGV